MDKAMEREGNKDMKNHAQSTTLNRAKMSSFYKFINNLVYHDKVFIFYGGLYAHILSFKRF